jgi:hypothetical protein
MLEAQDTFPVESPYPPQIINLNSYFPQAHPNFSPAPYSGPPDTVKPAFRTRSLPSGSARGTRGNIPGRGRSQSKWKEPTAGLNPSSIHDLGSLQPARSQPARSITRSSGSRGKKPYDDLAQSRELRLFNDNVWGAAKRWFVVMLWVEGHFFWASNERDAVVDRCITEAYEFALTDYQKSHSDAMDLIPKYRLQTQGSKDLAICRQIVGAMVKICVCGS